MNNLSIRDMARYKMKVLVKVPGMHLSCLMVALLCIVQVHAQVKLPRLICDGMVLQRNKPIHIWGWASPGEKILISFNHSKKEILSDAEGNWSTELPSMNAGGPYEMIIEGKNKISIKDILLGDVWICSGQSNMEVPMARVKYLYALDWNTYFNKQIRQFTVPDKYEFRYEEKDLSGGEWMKADEADLPKFSAVAYFFANNIYKHHKVPIGLINSALGGSPAECWISEPAIQKFPTYYQELQRFKNQELIHQIESADEQRSTEWYHYLNEKDQGLTGNWETGNFAGGEIRQMNVPGYWAGENQSPENGVYWFTRQFMVPASLATVSTRLELGRIVDADSVFVNGIFAGTTGYQYPPREYLLPPGILKTGQNRIVVRIVNSNGRGGFVPDKPYQILGQKDTIDLKGVWDYAIGTNAPPLAPPTFIRWKPVGLYNAMIAPLLKYTMTGVIWYQGESNVSRPEDYLELMQTLIADWRKNWHQGSFPFLFVQLANYMEAKPEPSESDLAELREQQLKTLKVPNTAMAVAIDVGEWNDIHPLHKKEVGERLALAARKMTYGEKNLVYSGPIYKEMKIQGEKIFIMFDHIGKGLIAKGKKNLTGFEIAGPDKKYYKAEASIENNKVCVWNTGITNPVSVRYAWADNPKGANLYNADGLPASPFTTEE